MQGIWLLAEEGRDALQAYRGPGTLLALDYDGTLAPIVAQRSRAVMRERTRALLAEVASRFPTVLITGRAREDAARFVAGLPLREIIGNHGLDLCAGERRVFRERVQGWREELAERLELCKGVVIEDKKLSLSLHYRQAPDPARARQFLWQVASQLEGARLVGGKKVVNVVPEEGATKADALLEACRRHDCARAIFVGDDETDEDAFAVSAPPVLGVRVGPRGPTRASYRLHDQGEVDALLEALLAGATERSSLQ